MGRADAEAPRAALLVGRPRQVTSTPGGEREPAISPDANLVAFVSSEAGNADIWMVGVGGANLLRLTDDPAADTKPSWFPDGSALAFASERGGTSAIWKVPVLGGAATLLVPDAREPAIDPTGAGVAFVRNGPSGSGRVAVAPLSDPTHVTVLTHDDDGLWDHRDPAWSPDGRYLAYAAQRGLWIVPAAGGESRRLTIDDEPDEEPVWSADGRYVFLSSDREGTRALWRVAVAGGRPERVTPGTGPETHPSLSRDGRRLACTTFNDNVDLVLREFATGKETTVPGARAESFPSFSPNGKTLVFVSDRVGGELRLWQQPLDSGQPSGPARMVTDHPSAYPAYSPDDKWIAYYRLGGGRDRDIWIVPSGGGLPVRFTDGPGEDVHPAWSPRGNEIAFASGDERSLHICVKPVLEGRPAGPTRQLTSGAVDHEAPAWSPDGTRLAFIDVGATGQTDVYVVPADGSEQPRRVTSFGRAERVKWHPRRPLLLVSGRDGLWISLREVSLADGTARQFELPIRFGREADRVDFDLTRDGRWLVFTRETVVGDVWVAEISEAGGRNPPAGGSRAP